MTPAKGFEFGDNYSNRIGHRESAEVIRRALADGTLTLYSGDACPLEKTYAAESANCFIGLDDLEKILIELEK